MKIGLIAGGGQFPVLFAKKAMDKGYQVYAVGFNNETSAELDSLVYQIKYLYLGQITKLIKFFKENDIQDAVMLGSIRKNNIFKNIRPDLKALTFIAKNVKTHDDSVLSAFADLLLKDGIKILSSTFLLPDLISPAGCWTNRKPDKAEKKDIEQGWRIASEIGKLDIGQCIVISNGTVLAVEAIDGTDETIRRGGRLSQNNGAVVVKRCKPTQDMRFDLPSTGCQTIETMHEAGASVLVLEAEKSLSFDREKMIQLANQYDIAIVGHTDNSI